MCVFDMVIVSAEHGMSHSLKLECHTSQVICALSLLL